MAPVRSVRFRSRHRNTISFLLSSFLLTGAYCNLVGRQKKKKEEKVDLKDKKDKKDKLLDEEKEAAMIMIASNGPQTSDP